MKLRFSYLALTLLLAEPFVSTAYAARHFIFSGQELSQLAAHRHFSQWDGTIAPGQYVIAPLRHPTPQLKTQPHLRGTAIVIKGHGIGGATVPHIGLMLYQRGVTSEASFLEFVRKVDETLRKRKLEVYLIGGAADDEGEFQKEMDHVIDVFRQRNIGIARAWQNVIQKKSPVALRYDDERQEDFLSDESLHFQTYIGGKGQGAFGILVKPSVVDSDYYWPTDSHMSWKTFPRTSAYTLDIE